jgi:hypothetical protein
MIKPKELEALLFIDVNKNNPKIKTLPLLQWHNSRFAILLSLQDTDLNGNSFLGMI